MDKCRNCGKEYTEGPLFGRDLNLCISCTLFKLDAEEKLLDKLKSDLHRITYREEKELIKKKRSNLKQDYYEKKYLDIRFRDFFKLLFRNFQKCRD